MAMTKSSPDLDAHPSLPPDLITRLDERIAKLEEWAHEPFDFSSLIKRLEKLEAVARKAFPLAHGEEVENCTQPEPRSSNAVVWHDGAEKPPVEHGHMREFVAAVYRRRTGKVYSFSSSYLNAYGLEYSHEPPEGCVCNGEHCEDGCPTTGWYEQIGDEDYSSKFNPLEIRDGDKLLGWCEIPQWAANEEITPTQFPKSIPPRQEPETAKLIEALKELRNALDGMRPFPLVIEPVVAGMVARADAALALSTALARSQAAPMPSEEEIEGILQATLRMKMLTDPDDDDQIFSARITDRSMEAAARAILDRLSPREEK